MSRPKDPRAQETCLIEGCEAPNYRTIYCASHYMRNYRYGDPLRPEGHTVERPKYRAAHKRLTIKRGRAQDLPCVDCGHPAHHWSYDGQDPNELVDEKTGCAYSTDLDRYAPRCVRCHGHHDRALRDGTPRRPA